MRRCPAPATPHFPGHEKRLLDRQVSGSRQHHAPRVVFADSSTILRGKSAWIGRLVRDWIGDWKGPPGMYDALATAPAPSGGRSVGGLAQSRDARSTRTPKPDAIALNAAVELAAVFVLKIERLEIA